jgi:carbonic anhydrase
MRKHLSKCIVVLMVVAWFLPVTSAAQTSESAQNITPVEALAKLKEGNERFVTGKSLHDNADEARRADTVKNGQHPFVTVLGCSDSRVPIEVLFDQGIGDVFVVRVAGNVADTDEVGSVEYGVEHLGSPLLVVLGHTQCGAVTAVVTNAKVEGSIPRLIDNIRPAVLRAHRNNPKLKGKELIPAAVDSNVWQSIEDVFHRSAIVRELAAEGKLMVIGAVYDLESGRINWLGEHPDQEKLVGSEHETGKTKHVAGKSNRKTVKKQAHRHVKKRYTQKSNKKHMHR